jgi:hypothetical protein
MIFTFQLRSEASKQRDVVTCTTLLDKLLQRDELELARVMAERQHNFQTGQNSVKVIYIVVDEIYSRNPN